MTKKIKDYFISIYPEHTNLFLSLGKINKIKPSLSPLPEAIVRVITSQMLSGVAANTIYNRIISVREKQNLYGSWQLDFESLKKCGLSSSKANSIIEFGSYLDNDIKKIDFWRHLNNEELNYEIKKFRGLGEWSAAIISIFHLGRADIFPKGDSSLNKVIVHLTSSGKVINSNYFFDVEKAAPYRSYLALYLWKALDERKFL